MVGHRTAVGHLADHVGTGDGDDDQPHVAVVDQQSVTGRDVVGQLPIHRRYPLRGAGHVLDGDRDPVTGAPLDRPVGEPAQPDLRALQVSQQADRATGPRGRPPHPLGRPLVVSVGAVAEVQPSDAHAGLDQRSDPLLRRRRRSERAHDLRPPGHRTTVPRARRPTGRLNRSTSGRRRTPGVDQPGYDSAPSMVSGSCTCQQGFGSSSGYCRTRRTARGRRGRMPLPSSRSFRRRAR